jgi:hypothetical protein
MKDISIEMKMPEIIVFAKVFIVGIIIAEVFRITFYLGESFAATLSSIDWRMKALAISISFLITVIYAVKRSAHLVGMKLVKSWRVDLLLVLLIGCTANYYIVSSLDAVHKLIQQASPRYAPIILVMLLLMLASSICRSFWMNWHSKKQVRSQLLFLEDEAIKSQDLDVFSNNSQALSFAQTVLESGSAHSGLVFGIDGPWGVGKTSFINLAENYWKANNTDELLVFRFEPLRYASESDLSQRFIKELSAVIQKQVYAPEFQPAASRYSRMLKSKTDMSFLGFKLSLESTNETIDEMLEDIDDVLKRIKRRLIIVIDDLDRLEPKAVNNVLFTVRRTFKLSQANYILCYDTENLIAGKDDGEKAREFLEKFVTLKFSLFIDNSNIIKYLESDWSSEKMLLTTPSDSMFKLSSIMQTLAELLKGNSTAQYMSLVGNLRKVKRFINAALLMQIEKTDLSKTDFDRKDLINLLLLHLSYPGVFRHIYAEETEGSEGIFSINRGFGEPNFSNSEKFAEFVERQDTNAQFLLKQLFDIETLELDVGQGIDEAVVKSRACFNHVPSRNLEKYLKLIVRFVTPEPRNTFVLYQRAVERARQGPVIAKELDKPDFDFTHGEKSHDKFWSLFVNQSHDLTSSVAEDAINTLIDFLPKYSLIDAPDIHQGLRSRSIYSLLGLLNKAGWGRTNNQPLANTPENILEIADRIFGENSHEDKGIIKNLAAADRGGLGWDDLMSFRLTCSADRQGSYHQVYSALILHQDNTARTDGLVSTLAINGMRKLSQEIFALFKERYINPKLNFFTDIMNIPDDAFLGSSATYFKQQEENFETTSRFPLPEQLESARLLVHHFVIYQLSNNRGPNGSGIGCGYYDEYGQDDSNSIKNLMTDYIFNVCFNPSICEENILHFADYCLLNFERTYRGVEIEYLPNQRSLAEGLDFSDMCKYWLDHKTLILSKNLTSMERRVISSNYTATYNQNLQSVFDILNQGVENQESE